MGKTERKEKPQTQQKKTERMKIGTLGTYKPTPKFNGFCKNC